MFWFCLSTDMRFFAAMVTVPVDGSSSPERIFINVDLPAPFAPIMP